MLQFTLKELLYKIEELKFLLEHIENNGVLEFQLLDRNIDLKGVVDIAQILSCKALLPQIVNGKNIIQFQKLDPLHSFHQQNDDVEKKYGANSSFATIDKTSQPSFMIHYLKALESVNIDTKKRVLNLGVNSGDEFEVIKNVSKNFKNIELVGVDYCTSAIQKGEEKFQEDPNIRFLKGDINQLEVLDLGKFDLIITIGTLQSSNIEFNKTFMNIVQNYLQKEGAMIVGFPNCRWIDGEMIYGARVKNYNYSELSNLYKDVNFCKRYLQQKKFRVTITGKDYIFLTATSIR